MGNLELTILRWKERKNLMQTAREETAMSGGVKGQEKGAIKKELSSMDAYIKTFEMFITDLYSLK